MLRLKKIFISNILIVLACILSSGVQAKSDNNEVKKCGVLPFDIESISDKAFPLINGRFREHLALTVKKNIEKLASNKLKLNLIKKASAITSMDMMPSVGFDDDYKNTLLSDLENIAFTNSVDCLIFGSLEENPLTGKGNLQLNIHIYTSTTNKTNTFSSSFINLLKNKKPVTKGSLLEFLVDETTKLSEKSFNYLLTSHSPVIKNKIEASAKNISIVPPSSKKDSSNSDESIENLLTAEIVPSSSRVTTDPLSEMEEDPVDEMAAVISKNNIIEPMSLSDIYMMFYQEGFYNRMFNQRDVKHASARRNVAANIGLSPADFYNKILYGQRKKIEKPYFISCTIKKLVSQPNNNKGHAFNLCYDIRYLHQKGGKIPVTEIHNSYCVDNNEKLQLLRGKGLVNISYNKAEQNIKELIKETKKPWRIPTLAELYALAGSIQTQQNSFPSKVGFGIDVDFPYYDEINGAYRTYDIWSSTPTKGSLNSRWAIAASKRFNRKFYGNKNQTGISIEYKYSPRIVELKALGQNMKVDRALLFPVYTCD